MARPSCKIKAVQEWDFFTPRWRRCCKTAKLDPPLESTLIAISIKLYINENEIIKKIDRKRAAEYSTVCFDAMAVNCSVMSAGRWRLLRANFRYFSNYEYTWKIIIIYPCHRLIKKFRFFSKQNINQHQRWSTNKKHLQIPRIKKKNSKLSNLKQHIYCTLDPEHITRKKQQLNRNAFEKYVR